ncbi:glycoside hydrolase [Hypomontagnella monticulosa]|nr:glycoside hydrolase [Hypomontagnella monticulosa]
MAKKSTYSSWLAGVLFFLAAIAPLADAATPVGTTLFKSVSTSMPTSTSTPPKSSSNSKRIVQYCGSLYAPGSLAKVHAAELVNSSRPIYVTNVLYGTWTLQGNKTMAISKNGSNIDPSLPSEAWAFDEMKTLQKAGVKVSMFMLSGWSQFINDTAFDSYYGVLRNTLRKYNFDGIDLDIEDNQDGNHHPITLEPAVRLIKQLRKDFGPDFVITLAPISTALVRGENLSHFSYKELEKRCGDDISWYNVQFYYESEELASTDSVDAVMKNGWKPERIVIGMDTTPDFPPFVELPIVAKTLHKLAAKYPDIRGVDGFDYYDQKPGGYPAPWEWPRWAARQMGWTNRTSVDDARTMNIMG